jgi:uncharacterized protein
MSGPEGGLIVLAGVAAGLINAVVGSGTLVTFPALLAVGLPPVSANVTNTVGLVPGSVAGAWGYRRELAGQGRRLLWLGGVSVIGAVVGAVLLLVLPAAAFRAIVPVLILAACVLVVAQPRLARRAADRHGGHPRSEGPTLRLGVLASGVYGGYFGAAQGVLLIGLLGTMLDEDLQRVNAAKNVLTGLVNFTAGLVFLAVADVRWDFAAVLALGAAAGGWLGAHVGRRLPPLVLRGVIVAIGAIAIVRLLAG